MVYQAGNTIRLNASFADSDDVAIDPITPLLKLYDSNYELLNTYTPTKVSTGNYYYDLTLPSVEALTNYIYEWSTISESNPIIKRRRLQVDFI